MSKQPPSAPTASTIGPCPTIIQINRTPRHWKFTQHLRTTRPPRHDVDATSLRVRRRHDVMCLLGICPPCPPQYPKPCPPPNILNLPTPMHISAIFAQRLIGPLASLDVSWRHVHVMLKSRHTRDWWVQFWSMVVQFGTPKVYFFKMNLKRCRKGQLNL